MRGKIERRSLRPSPAFGYGSSVLTGLLLVVLAAARSVFSALASSAQGRRRLALGVWLLLLGRGLLEFGIRC